MKKITSLLTLVFLLLTAAAQAQGTIRGTVVDGENGTPLPGVNVVIEGTTNGVSTDFDGNFSISPKTETGVLAISYVGFKKKTIPFTNSSQDMGTISLMVDSDALDEVIVTAYNLAIDRKTPVAVSTIKAAEIENKLGNQEFPEIVRNTPGIYVTRGGGGFGDSELRLRGFNSENVAVMINGIPVNDMENGRVYWSNWAGLSDVTSTIQIQRGLGASKLAVPSIGGTMNIVTKSTDAEKGGNVNMMTGNDGYTKYGFTLSTGLMDNGWAATIAASKTSGRGFVDGTPFEAYSYFLNIAKEINENQSLSLTVFGAPQVHGQRQNRLLINDFRVSERGIKTNIDYGYLNGQFVSIEDNFYHKPKAMLNHFWDINDKTRLATSIYASYGTGGGGGRSGVNKFQADNLNYRDEIYGPVNLDIIVDENKALGIEGSETILRASRNNHQWYGAISTLSTELTENIDFSGGLDIRWYKGEHFTELTDLLGGRYFLDDSNVNNPVFAAKEGDKILYYDEGFTRWAGVFTQAEYSKDELSAFVSAAANRTSYKRIDYFNYEDGDPLQETDWIGFTGGSIKGGANYNLDGVNNVFANIGYFERAPFNNAVFLNFSNLENEDAVNQKIFSAELGYGLRTSKFRADVNLYRTQWNDRTEIVNRSTDEEVIIGNILGVNALHQGVELEFEYRPTDKLSFDGMVSIGDWKWNNNVEGVELFNDERELVETVDVIIDGLKVGNSAQTTFALGGSYDIIPSTTLRANYFFAGDYYSDFDPSDRGSAGPQTWKMPDYGLLDLGLTHRFQFGGFATVLRANVFNVLDTEYISDSQDGPGSNAANAQVFFGPGRTYSVGATINF
ncbi:TonB-dependent receptor [Leeuwenhoekiella parthenopeia]|uniref:TonB-dependent receptor n=1 Tax=Leeuwenhoekiella parthenopeia TaxID=2890320 RepID=A0ABS8GP84_9FLAO|nr:carboxypeptidase-like regulatory domain-containing protein [Leeuwenhoekiella parthenopeia]MCC4211770.1 TonB-dependent receptor [Leeuwenhoekiella parthenopeia]